MTNTPIDPTVCPLCGQKNACARELNPSNPAPCWCEDMDFSADLLAAIPTTHQRLSCVCANCAQKASAPTEQN